MPKTLFISHSTTDDTHIDKIALTLEAHGHTVWIDHRNGITPNDSNWDKAIRTAISQADAGIFVMSKRSLGSDICGSECLLVRELGKPLYVLRLEICDPADIWLYIKQIQYADLTADFEVGIRSLLDVLDGQSQTAITPIPVLGKVTGRETIHQHLPFLNNPLRGRDKDVATVMKMLGGHITQVIGMGGLGKSRLCAEIALAYPNGAVWHRCSAVSRSYQIADLLRGHFGLSSEMPIEDVLAITAEHKPLIVIDNAEDVTPNTPAHNDYVKLMNQLTAYGVPILLTSRVVWHEFKPRKQHIPAIVDQATAAQLASDFANSQNVTLTPDQADELGRSARQHPRLIEFAIGQLHETPYRTVIKRLETLNHADTEAALYDIIIKTLEQMRDTAPNGKIAYDLIHNMTWLQGTFPLDAVNALQPATITDEDVLIDALTTLQRYQFVRYDPTTERYRLEPLVVETLGTPQDDRLFGKYALHYTTCASRIFRDLPPEQWHLHEADMPNIAYLAEQLMTNIQHDTVGDYQRMRWFAKATIRYVARRAEARAGAWVQAGLKSVQALKKRQRGNRQKHELTKDEAIFYNNLGFIHSISGEHQQALDCYQQALALNIETNSIGGEALALTNIGYVWGLMDDYHKALDYYEQALKLRKQDDDVQGEAATLNNIGTAWLMLDEYAKALDYYQQALPLRRQINDKWGEATALTNIGKTFAKLGDFNQALDYLLQAVPLRQLVGDRRGEGVTWHNIAKVHEQTGDVDKALEATQKAIEITYEHDFNLATYRETLTRLREG